VRFFPPTVNTGGLTVYFNGAFTGS
jgi:hypothetical protein